MKNDSPDWLFGKHEMGVCAVAIVKACESKGSWNVCFEVPNRGEPHHIGFTWLISSQRLRPVSSMSFAWVVTQSFVDYMAGRHELPDTLGEYHGIYDGSPGDFAGSPRLQHGELAP